MNYLSTYHGHLCYRYICEWIETMAKTNFKHIQCISNETIFFFRARETKFQTPESCDIYQAKLIMFIALKHDKLLTTMQFFGYDFIKPQAWHTGTTGHIHQFERVQWNCGIKSGMWCDLIAVERCMNVANVHIVSIYCTNTWDILMHKYWSIHTIQVSKAEFSSTYDK